MRILFALTLGIASLPLGARAQSTPAVQVAPSPYSLPWQLRPASAVSVLRSDTSVSLFNDATGAGGSAVVSTLLGSYRVTPNLSPLVRLAFVESSPPTAGGTTLLANPLLGALYGLKPSDDLRLSLFFAVALPIGMGGGDTPDAAQTAGLKSAIFARSALDNALFAVNFLTFIPGAGIAYVKHGFTAQLEVTFLELIRARGSAVEKDETRTNFTTGLHLGYFLAPWISLGGELRYQRWLSTPAAVAADATGSARDNLTVAIGPRGHFNLGGSFWLRPGVAYVQGIDDPMSATSTRAIQIDLPFAF